MNYNLFIIIILLVLLSFCYAFRAKLSGGQLNFFGLLVIWVAIVSYIYSIILSFTHPLIALLISVVLILGGSLYLIKSFKVQREPNESENIEYENIDAVSYIPYSELKNNEDILLEANGDIKSYDRVQNNWTQTQNFREDNSEHLDKVQEKNFLEEGKVYYLPLANKEKQLKDIWSLIENRKYAISDLIDLSFQCKEENDYLLAKEYLLAVIYKSDNINVKKIACMEAVYLYKIMGKYQEAKQLAEVFISREGKYMPHEEIQHYHFLASYLKYLDKFLKQVGKEGISFDIVPGLINNSALKLSREEVNITGTFEKNNKRLYNSTEARL